MHILIVHDDAEVGEQLTRMVRDYTAHPCDLVENEAAALRWAREHARCRLLFAQLEGPGGDGFALSGSLGEIFPGLQTLFFPAYPAAEQRIEVADTKVFPEPIDGERLLQAIESAATAGSGAPDLFQVLDVLQMCCLSGRSGAVQVVKQNQSGIVYLREGNIVHAEGAATHGIEALREIAAWGLVEFAYDGSLRTTETISLPWDEAIDPRKEEGPDCPPASEPPTATDVAPPPKKRGFFSALRRG